MIFDPAFHVIVKHNPSRAIMPPHIRGVPFIFLSYPRFRRYRGCTAGLRYAAHMRGLKFPLAKGSQQFLLQRRTPLRALRRTHVVR